MGIVYVVYRVPLYRLCISRNQRRVSQSVVCCKSTMMMMNDDE
jgi:hypothetical protein